MELPKLQIVPTGLWNDYSLQFSGQAHGIFNSLHESAISTHTFSFYTSVSAVFSSKIEGEDVELDSYIKHKATGAKFLPDYTQKTDDLYNAYLFAQQAPLNSGNLMQAHAMLTQHILQPEQRGAMRTGNMYVVTPGGKIEYVAAAPAVIAVEMQKLYSDIELLLNKPLSFEQSFFYASLIHLVFIKIHPLNDGNGRCARLLEKWFLAEKLGKKAWFLNSEKYYYQNHHLYYSNIRRLGLEYETLDYTQALPFLNMLPAALQPESED